MAFLDKTFCSSTNCENKCGRKMLEDEINLLKSLPYESCASKAALKGLVKK